MVGRLQPRYRHKRIHQELEARLYATTVTPSGGDDAEEIQAALDDAATLGDASSAIVFLNSLASYQISQPLSIPGSVELMGRGGGQYPASAFATSENFKATSKTRIVPTAAFPSDSPLIRVATTPGDAYSIQNARVARLMLDCDHIADRGIDVVSAKHCVFEDLLIYRPNLIGVFEDNLPSPQTGTAQTGTSNSITLQTTASTREDIYVGLVITLTSGTGSGQTATVTDYDGLNQIATVSPAWGTIPDSTTHYAVANGSVTEGVGALQFCRWNGITVWCGNTGDARGWVQDGNPTNDVNQCEYHSIKIVHCNGDAIDMIDADSNFWFTVNTFSFGTGVGVRMHGNSKNGAEYCRNMTMYGVQFFNLTAAPDGGGCVIENGNVTRNSTTGVRPSVFNSIYGYGTTGCPLPTIEDNAGLFYLTDRFVYFSDNSQAQIFTQHTNAFGAGGARASWRHLGKLVDGTEQELGRIVARVQGGAGTEALAWDFWGWENGAETLLGTIGAAAAVSFTPELLFGGDNTGMTGTFAGSYIRLGQIIFVHIAVILTDKGSATGAVSVTIDDSGFTSVTGTSFSISIDNLDAGVGSSGFSVIIPPASQSLAIYKMVSGDRTVLSHTDFTNTTTFSTDGFFLV